MKINSTMVWLGILVIGCAPSVEPIASSIEGEALRPIAIPGDTINRSALIFNPQTSLWTTIEGQRFSGYAVSRYPDGTDQQQLGIFEGKRQGSAREWYPNGQLKVLANYHQGKLHGEKKVWTAGPTAVLIAHLNYHLGKAHGEQKKWYSTGEIYKILHLNKGKEEGLQQAFRKNGDLYANYEAREGRIFGLKRAALCYELEDEKIQYNN